MTPEQYIEQLDLASARFHSIAIAVRFADEVECKLVFASKQDRLERLTRLVQAGGEPVGTIGMMKTSQQGDAETFEAMTSPFPELEKEPWAHEYLAAAVRSWAKGIQERGGKILPPENPANN